MSTTPFQNEQNDDPGSVVAGAEIARMLKGIDTAFRERDEIDAVLVDVLYLLASSPGTQAAIVWKATGDAFRWHASEGVTLEDAVQESEFTSDVITNVNTAFEDGVADIFTCPPDAVDSLPTADEAPDPAIRELVVQCRQIVLPVFDDHAPVAVFVLFQPVSGAGSGWTINDVETLQNHIEYWLSNINDIEPSEVDSNEKEPPAAKAEPKESNDTIVKIADATHVAQDSEELNSVKGGDDHAIVVPPVADLGPPAEPESPEQLPSQESSVTLDLDDEEAYFQSKQMLFDQQRAKRVIDNVGRSLHEVECCYDVANELHAYFGEGRISVGIFRGSTCHIRAISNQQVFDRRSAAVSSLERLAAKCAQTRRAIWHPEDEESLPSDLAILFEEYYEAADSQSLALIPLVRPQDPNTDPNDLKAVIRDRQSSAGEVVGVLIIEGLHATLGREDIQPQWSLVETPVVNAIANAKKHNSLFLMPVWKELGHFTDLFRGHHRNKAMGAAVAVSALIAGLVAIPGDFKLRSEGVVQPLNRSKVYAETAGIVNELLVSDGQWVEKGEVLLTLSNPELYAELAKVEGELRETSEKLKTAKLQRMRGDFKLDEDRAANVLESAGYAATLEKLKEQADLLREKKNQLVIKSPVAGQVMTWDTHRRLMARPVEPGQKLLVVADAKGPWELELKLADKRSGYLREVWQDNVALTSATLDQSDPNPNQNQRTKPKATYVLASHPSDVMNGVVREVSQSADVDEEEGNIIRVYVDLEKHPSETDLRVRPGTEVIAHIHAGRASIGYCKLFEFFDWIRRAWFRFA